MSNKTYIPNRIESAVKGGFVTGAKDIIDDNLNKNQEQLNEFFDETAKDTYRKEQVNNLISRTPETDIIVMRGMNGTVIDNIYPHDASAWEMGTLSSVDGTPVDSQYRCRTINYILVDNPYSFTISHIAGETALDCGIAFYGDEGFISDTRWTSPEEVIAPEGTKSIKFYTRLHDDVPGTITPAIAAAGINCQLELADGLDVIPVEERANKLFRIPGPTNTTYSEWAWDGTEWVMLANKDYGIDDEPFPDSDNTVKSGGVASRLFNGLFIGKGNTLVKSGKLYGFIPNKKYRIIIVNPNFNRDAVTAQGIIFRLSSYYNDVETVLYPVNITYANNNLVGNYDITIPNHCDYLEVQGRANEGVKVRFLFESLDAINDKIIESETQEELITKGNYTWELDLSQFIGTSIISSDYVKIPLKVNANTLVKLYYNSNTLNDLKRVYVKYKNESERVNIFAAANNYVQEGNVYQFVAEHDTEYLTFWSEDGYNITAESYLIFHIMTNKGDLTIIDSNYWNIYKSKTNNLLDVNNVLNGVSIDNETREATLDPRGVISRPIFIGDIVGKKITFSGFTDEYGVQYCKRAIYFLNKPSFSSDAIVEWYNFVEDPRTVTVPPAVYMVVCLRNKDFDMYSRSGLVDYLNVKIAVGEEVTEDVFEGEYLFNALEYKNMMFTSSSKNILDTSLSFNDMNITDDPPYFIEGDTGIAVCGPIYIKGAKKITFRNTSAFYTGRKWILFTTDTSRTEESVVGVSYIPTNPNGDLQEITFSVPQNAVWFYVKIKVVYEDDATALQMTCAIGDTPTTDKFERAVAGIANMPIVPLTTNEDNKNNNNDPVLDFEKVSTLKRYLPYSIGAPIIENNTIVPFTGKYERVHLLFFTDNHIENNDGDASVDNIRNTVDFINNSKISFDAVLNAGDCITPFGVISKQTAIGWNEKFFNICKQSKYPFIFAKGNHDSNDWYNTPANALDDDDWSSLIYNHMESEYGFVRQTKANGKKSSYGYYDIVAHKIRVIVIDCQDIDRTPVDGEGHCKYYGGNAFHISDEQFQWMANNALSFNENGWGVIILLHQVFTQRNVWYTVENMPSSIQKFYNMVKAFNNHTTFTNEAYTYPADSFYDLSAFTKDFSFGNLTDKPKVICWLIGHEHFDRVVTQDGMNLIWTLNGGSTNSSSDQRVPKIIGTPYQTAFDLISIDTNLHKIWFVRYGSGENCYGVGGDRFIPAGLSY